MPLCGGYGLSSTAHKVFSTIVTFVAEAFCSCLKALLIESAISLSKSYQWNGQRYFPIFISATVAGNILWIEMTLLIHEFWLIDLIRGFQYSMGTSPPIKSIINQSTFSLFCFYAKSQNKNLFTFGCTIRQWKLICKAISSMWFRVIHEIYIQNNIFISN